MNYRTNINDFLKIAELDSANKTAIFDTAGSELTLIWNRGGTMQITIDKACYEIAKNAIFFLNSYHPITRLDLVSARMLRFSKTFLCGTAQQGRIDLKSLCSFSAGQLQIIAMDQNELNHLESAWAFFCNEMYSKDHLQNDMLQLLLKRILSLCTKTPQWEDQKKADSDIVSSFSYLVEDHYFEHHDVAFYASKLNKTPKTLSILFSLVMGCPPKDFIHERIMAGARNQIQYTDKSIKEIAYDLGYEDIQTFSRFFKNKEGISPLHYREKYKTDTTAVQGHQFSA